MKINLKLLPMKLHFFLFSGGSAPVSPFIPIIAKDLGFSAFITSTFFTIATILSLLIKPFIGGLADKLKKQKTIFIILIILTTAIYFSFQFISPLPIDSSVILNCSLVPKLQFTSNKLSEKCFVSELTNGGEIYCQLNCDNYFMKNAFRINASNFNIIINSSSLVTDYNNNNASIDLSYIEIGSKIKPVCYKQLFAKCQMKCNNLAMTELLNKPMVRGSQVFGYSSFWILLIMITAGRTFANAINSIGDAICFNLLGNKPNDFGMQRLWGSVGWGVSPIITGLIVDYVSKGLPRKNFTIAFYFSLVLLIIDAFVCKTLQYKAVSKPVNVFKDVRKVMADTKIIVFMIWSMLCGIYMSIIFYFLFWYLEDIASEMGCNNMVWIKTLEGLVIAFHSYLGEIPFFLISGWLLKKIGHINSMTLVLFINGVRLLLLSIITNPWYALPIEITNGITYGTFYVTMATYANKVSPLGTETTVQNLVCAMYDGLGSAIGTLMGGYMLQNLGGRETYWIFGLSALFFTVLHIVVQFFLNKKEVKSDI